MSVLVEVKQTPDLSAQMLGLDKHNRSKFPGTFETIQATKGPDGRWITGLDEDAVSIRSISDVELREKRREEVKALREDLQNLTGLDLSAKSIFWNTFFINIVEKLALNFDNPMDVIKYHVLIANKHAAPELEAKNDPDFMHTKFYMHRSENEEGQKAVKTREKDKAVADLYKLYDNPNKLRLIGKYLFGTIIKDTMTTDGVYNYIRSKIEAEKEGTITRKFNEATSKTIEELTYKLVIDEAIQKHVIRIREGYYQRGNATYGKSMKEVIKFLSSPENANEFASVKEEVDEKRALG